MEPLVLSYLKAHSLHSLENAYGICTSAKEGDSVFSLNYDQIASKPGIIVNQCRGLILSTQDGSGLTREQIHGEEGIPGLFVMARPFDRFFNYGDPNAASIDMEDDGTVFYEKLDGTLCIVHFNPLDEKWYVATRSVPTANREISGWKDWTFRRLFEKALTDTLAADGRDNVSFDEWSKRLDHEYTYCFELTTPLNRIVVRYEDYRIHLLGMRHTLNGTEVFPNHSTGVAPCPSHKLSNLSELLSFVGSRGPMEQEGVVVCDKNFRRVKVKSLAYVAYNKIRDATANSPRGVMELILSEKLDDVLSILDPYIQQEAVKLQSGLRTLIATNDRIYDECAKEAEGQENKRKAFALAVQARNGWMSPLMDRFCGGNEGILDFFKKNKDSIKNTWQDGFLDKLIELSRISVNASAETS